MAQNNNTNSNSIKGPVGFGKIKDKTPKINSVSGKLDIEIKTSFYFKENAADNSSIDLGGIISVRKNFFSNRI